MILDGDPPLARLDGARFLRLVRNHHPDPLGVGWGPSRFVPGPDDTALGSARFRTLYAAGTLATAFAETVLRDEAVGAGACFPIALSTLAAWDVVTIEVHGLACLDLMGTGLARSRVPTDAVRARVQREGRRLGAALYDHPACPDGLIYPSRLTGERNLMVFDRAITSRLSTLDRMALLEIAAFADVLDAFDLAVDQDG